MADPTGADPAAAEPALLARLREHFGRDPAALPVVEQEFAAYERANVQLALAELLDESDRTADLVGVIALEEYRSTSLARMARAASARAYDAGPVEYADVPLPGDRQLACVKNGLYLVRDGGHPLAVLLTESRHPFQPNFGTEVMAADRDRAEAFSRRLGKLVRHGKAFRGHILSLQADCHGGLSVLFHRLPPVARDDLILPEALLRRVERHTLTFNRHAEVLKAAGRHLKRGLLLHGPPGTGKTLTAMYLVSQMPGRTVLLLTGAGAGLIETAGKLARMLAPATVILEDVDLIGTERNQQSIGANALLFELLNQMDGLAEDTDVVFVLTTNRPDVLEPALAARPGRIDQAIEVPPPDADCRRRLLERFGRGLRLELADWAGLVARTAGVSGAFLKELLRKAAVFAAEDGGELVVRDRHVEEALGELLVAGGPLTQSLLGARAGAAAGG
ncbi:26S protease regulatory subunit [bacterium]|nr:26S protease regulatory subunit [bacterium]